MHHHHVGGVNERRSGDVIDAVGEIFSEYVRPHTANGKNNGSSKFYEDKKKYLGASSFTTRAELGRIYELWQHAKQELQAKSREIARLKANQGFTQVEAKLSKVNSSENDRLLRRVGELEQENKILSNQLEECRNENDRWSQSYETLSSELQLVREMQEAARLENAQTETRTRELEDRVLSLSKEKERLISESIQQVRNYEEDLHVSKIHSSEFQTRMKNLANDLHQCNIERDILSKQKFELEMNLEQKEKTICRLEERVETMQRDLQSDSRIAAKYQINEMQARIDHLKVDNTRLFKLLTGTTEYRGFCDYLLDAGDPDGVTYFPDSKSKLPDQHLLKTSGLSSSCHEKCKSPKHNTTKPNKIKKVYHSNNNSFIDRKEFRSLEQEYGQHINELLKGDSMFTSSKHEHERWIPTEAVRLGTGFRNLYLPHVSMDLIGRFLKDLNHVWQRREKKIIRLLNEKHEKKLDELKRQIEQSQPYEKVMQKYKINRLEKSLRSMRTSTSKNIKKTSELATKPSFILEKSSNVNLAACLAEIEELSRTLESKNEIINKLQRGLDDQNESKLSLKIEEAFESTKQNTQKIKNRIRECMSKISYLGTNKSLDKDYVPLIHRAYSAMMDDLEEYVDELDQSLEQFLDTTPSYQQILRTSTASSNIKLSDL